MSDHMSDRAHLNGQSRPAIRVEAAPPDHNDAATPEDQFDAPTALLRLLVGGALVGADELLERLHVWDATTRATAMPSSEPMAGAPHSSASLRHALLGMVFESEVRVRQRFSTTLARLGRLAEEAEAHYDEVIEPDMRQTPLDPLLTRLDEWFFALETTVERWTALGQSEELSGRRMARLASTSVVDELLDYMARNPEVRQLIEQQATSMAGVAVEEVRGRTMTADLWIERLAHRVLRRPMSDTQSDDMDTLDAPLVRAEARTVASPASLQTSETPSVSNSVRTSPAMGILEAGSHADSGG